jgi:hypothetical protein
MARRAPLSLTPHTNHKANALEVIAIASDKRFVAQPDRQIELEHADEVHRPDAGTHRDCAAHQPAFSFPAF